MRTAFAAIVSVLLALSPASAEPYDWANSPWQGTTQVQPLAPTDCLATPEAGAPVLHHLGRGANLQVAEWGKAGWVAIDLNPGPCWVPAGDVAPAFGGAVPVGCPCGSGAYCTGRNGGRYCTADQPERRYGR